MQVTAVGRLHTANRRQEKEKGGKERGVRWRDIAKDERKVKYVRMRKRSKG